MESAQHSMPHPRQCTTQVHPQKKPNRHDSGALSEGAGETATAVATEDPHRIHEASFGFGDMAFKSRGSNATTSALLQPSASQDAQAACIIRARRVTGAPSSAAPSSVWPLLAASSTAHAAITEGDASGQTDSFPNNPTVSPNKWYVSASRNTPCHVGNTAVTPARTCAAMGGARLAAIDAKPVERGPRSDAAFMGPRSEATSPERGPRSEATCLERDPRSEASSAVQGTRSEGVDCGAARSEATCVKCCLWPEAPP